jgi:hypothetical protein
MGRALLAAAAAQIAPALYWHTSPNVPGDTVMYAGGFDLTASAAVFQCTDGTACTSRSPVPVVDAWSQSVKFAYPAACMPPSGPCTFAICASSDPGAPCTITSDPNAPDVWFSNAFPSLGGTTFIPSPSSPDGTGTTWLNAGGGSLSLLRVFGRSLAFYPGNFTCIPASARQPSTSTVLLLTPTSTPIPATVATCYELTFDLSAASLAPSYPDAVVQTPFGSFPLPLVTPPPSDAAQVAVIDVDAQAGGNVTLALAMAAGGASTLVQLGPHAYTLTAPVVVPNNTVLAGSSTSSSVLAFDVGYTGPSGAPLVSGSTNWGLRNFTLLVLTAPAQTAAVHHTAGGTNFTASGLNVTLTQLNVSNAFHVEGARFSITDSDIVQAGVCLWPPTDDNTPFQASTTMFFHGALDGFVQRNTLIWHCSAYDLDVSSRIVWEDNTITETDAGVFPHGNSVSFYDWGRFPYASVSYSYSHNVQSRPPNHNRTDDAFHETWTTDGPGGWGAGTVGALDGTLVTVPTGLTTDLQAAGATALIVNGPGTGQWRPVVSRPSATTVVLASPFDGHVVPNASVVAVVATVGGKIISDNTFVWGSVVQFFGTTLTGVVADNSFSHSANCGADSGGVDGSLTTFGLCYDGPQSAFFVEYAGNEMDSSNGISVHDVSPASNCNASYPGPYVRWVTMRRNTIGGISICSPGVCGSINATNGQTTDIVAEENVFNCAPGNLLPGGNGLNIYAEHSVAK